MPCLPAPSQQLGLWINYFSYSLTSSLANHLRHTVHKKPLAVRILVITSKQSLNLSKDVAS